MFENETHTPETENLEPEATEPEGQPTPEEQKILELESVDKFRFGGREWTPKDLQGAYMMQADYSRKTQEIAQERKYYDNLQVDLDSVRQNPRLADKFKSIYPEKFHKFLGYISPQSPAQTQAQPQQGNQTQRTQDPELIERLNRIESEFNERKVEAINAELDAKFAKLSAKNPYADEEAVVARAQALIDRGEKLTDTVWENLWKSVNDRNKSLAEKAHSSRIKEQKNINQKSKDVASGGGIPGQAPKLPRTIKEAGELARRDLEGS